MPYTALITERRNWSQALLLAICVSAGANALLDPATRPLLERVLPHWVQTGWSWALVIGGAVALCATVAKPGPAAILVERMGLTLLFGASLAYPLLVLAYAWEKPEAYPYAVPVVAFCAVMGNRMWRITRVVWLVGGVPWLVRAVLPARFLAWLVK